jgi:hypothetical protein
MDFIITDYTCIYTSCPYTHKFEITVVYIYIYICAHYKFILANAIVKYTKNRTYMCIQLVLISPKYPLV